MRGRGIPTALSLLVSHNVLEAERVLDRVLVMTHGQIRHDGHPRALCEEAGDFLTVSVTATHDVTMLADDVSGVSDRVHSHPPHWNLPHPDRLLCLFWLAG